MVPRARLLVPLLAAALTPGAAGSAEPVARYPAQVRLEVPAETRAFVYAFTPRYAPPILPNPETLVYVGDQAVAAYEAALGRMFGGAGTGPQASLVVSMAGEDVAVGDRGWVAFVEHDLELRNPAGEALATWRVRGEAPIRGVERRAVPDAFAAAAARAAAAFEADFEKAPGARAWLVSQGVTAGERQAPALVDRAQPTPVPVVRPRSDQVVFVEGGGAALVSRGHPGGGLSLRVGWSSHRWLGRLTLGYWTLASTVQPVAAWGGGTADVTVLVPGADVGALLRLSRAVELGGGVGVHMLQAQARATYRPLTDPRITTSASASASAVGMSAFAGVTGVGILPRTGLRYRLGFEARGYLGMTADLPSLGRKLRAVDGAALATLGVEFPLGASVESAR